MGLAAPAAHPGDVGGEHGGGGGLQDRRMQRDRAAGWDGGRDKGCVGGCLTSSLFFTASFKALRGSSGSVQFRSQLSRDCRKVCTEGRPGKYCAKNRGKTW